MKDPRKIDFLSDTALLVGLLGEMGLHAHTIAERVGMTQCQVRYRLKKYEIALRDYRNAKGQFDFIYKAARPGLDSRLRTRMKIKFGP